MKSEIHIIAEAILANTQVLKMLVEKLPAAAQAEVAAVVNTTPAPAPVQAPAAPVVTAPAPAPAPVVTAPAAPIPAAPVTATPTPPAPAPAAPAPSKCPFVDQKGLITYVMDAYKQMGQQKGSRIQGVLDSLGIKNINETKPEFYQPLYEGVEALKNDA